MAGLSCKRLKGLEPSTFCMASRRSSQLSYSRESGHYRRNVTPSRDDLERVRTSYEEFNARFQQVKAGDLTGLEEYCTEDIELVPVDGWPVSGRFVGIDGYRRWIREVYGGTAENRFEQIEVQVVGPYVVATMLSRGRADDDPTEMEAPIGVVHELRDGRIAKVWMYLGGERALRAAADGPPG